MFVCPDSRACNWRAETHSFLTEEIAARSIFCSHRKNSSRGFWRYDDGPEFEIIKYDLFAQELNQAVSGHKIHQIKLSPIFGFEMAELMNRCRGLAEGVVVMICPVLLALSLNMVSLNGEVYGHDGFVATLAIACVTLITGIFPFLACCFLEGLLLRPNPAPVTAILAIISSSCLVVLACLIAQLLVPKSMWIIVGAVTGFFILIRIVRYYRSQNDVDREYTQEMHKILDESYEFLTGVTGVLFLGFEALALDGRSQMMGQKVPVGTICFVLCAVGVLLMLLEMTPPPCYAVNKTGTDEEKKKGEEQIWQLTVVLDCVMAAGTFILLLVVMLKLTPFKVALWIFLPPVLSFGLLVLLVALNGRDEEESKPASLELTKVTFTGFLAVSVTAISNTSPSKLTGLFLLLSSMAIVFGLSWRLLSQTNIRSALDHYASSAHVASVAKLASFCAHLSVVIATILFVVMARKASGK